MWRQGSVFSQAAAPVNVPAYLRSSSLDTATIYRLPAVAVSPDASPAGSAWADDAPRSPVLQPDPRAVRQQSGHAILQAEASDSRVGSGAG